MNTTINKIFIILALFIGGSFVAPVAFAAGPSMNTNPASGITQTQATLNGTWSNASASTNVRFEYGTTASLGSSTSYVSMTNSNGSYSAPLSGLSPNTIYYFRAMGVDSTGPGFGSTLTFTTAGYSLPTIITAPATSVTANTAVLNGVFTTNGFATQTWFEYANNAGLVGSSPTSAVTQSGANGNMSATISGLLPGTTYYFRAVGSNSAGTKYSTTIPFTTALSNPASSLCTIGYFNADQTMVNPGNAVNFSWSTSNCTNVTLTSVGSVALSSTGYAVYPGQTTTYTLNASGSSGSDSRSITVIANNGSGCGTNCGNGCWSYQCGNGTGGSWTGGSGSYPTVYYSPYYYPSPQYVSQPSYQPTYGYGYGQNTAPAAPVAPSQPQAAPAPTIIYVTDSRTSSGTKASSTSSTTNTSSSSSDKAKAGEAGTPADASTSEASSLTASAFMAGNFLPHTAIGWLFLIIFMLVVVLIARSVFARTGGHPGTHGH